MSGRLAPEWVDGLDRNAWTPCSGISGRNQPEYAVQVSDRRLVRVNGKSAVVVDEESSKAIVYSDYFAVGYTGLADICGMRTNEWIAHHMSSQPTLMSAIRQLVRAANEHFSKHIAHYPSSWRRQGFVIAGFATKEPTSEPLPIVIRISNAQDSHGKWLSNAQSTFSVRERWFAGSELFGLDITGQPIHPTTERWLKRWLRRALERDAGPAAVARLLANAVAETSSLSPMVGRSMTVVGVVKDVPQRGAVRYTPSGQRIVQQLILNRAPYRGGASFLYLNRHGKNNPQLGPCVIWPGTMFTNFVATTLSNGQRVAATGYLPVRPAPAPAKPEQS
jgi:hypothetical protein